MNEAEAVIDNETKLMQASADNYEKYLRKQKRQDLKIQCLNLAQGVKDTNGENGSAMEILNAAKLFYEFARK